MSDDRKAKPVCLSEEPPQLRFVPRVSEIDLSFQKVELQAKVASFLTPSELLERVRLKGIEGAKRNQTIRVSSSLIPRPIVFCFDEGSP
jgi:hypothetical protein